MRHKLSEYDLVFIDDILVFSKSGAGHKQHLDAIMAVLRVNQDINKGFQMSMAVRLSWLIWVISSASKVLNLTLIRCRR